MTTAAYVRVSTSCQNTDSQKREIQRYLDGHGLEQVTWFIDEATGTTLDRPSFRRLEAEIFSGAVNTVVLYKLDRLSRSLHDGINTICRWADQDVHIIAVTQQIDISGVVGKIICSVLLGVAEMEQEIRRERQAAGISAAKDRGIYTGRQPGTTKAVPARAKELRDKGLTYSEVASVLGVSRTTVMRYLKR